MCCEGALRVSPSNAYWSCHFQPSCTLDFRISRSIKPSDSGSQRLGIISCVFDPLLFGQTYGSCTRGWRQGLNFSINLARPVGRPALFLFPACFGLLFFFLSRCLAAERSTNEDGPSSRENDRLLD